MDVLGSPLEAIVFNYLNLGLLAVANSLWTWVAILTAAFSVWRIRAVGFYPRRPKSDLYSSFNDRITYESHALFELTPSESSEKPSQSSSESDKPSGACRVMCPSSSCSSSVWTVEDEGRTKGGKYTVHYYYEEVHDNGESTPREISDDEVAVAEGADGGCWDGGDIGEGCSSFGGIFISRWGRGDLGWYRYQDPTVLNGSIVRLWDDHGSSHY
ncbi:PREDICTED: uncharacterized protein LOC104609306 [Nelumbo nucifera]|uniref:Uncharacterized protein n=2 Tax=Nelumbo nucifera TaxID=4432 RepID=A0A822ZVU6_NELNU|nr:PREDICTED: uncharacterized protein LOC104609306 [Nelumbo nucifera]DAD49133.1 TPA_asm: hypothetical protein HUJ06_019070 [Nelumbo nucifera]